MLSFPNNGPTFSIRRRFENMSHNFYQNTITSSFISSILKSSSIKFDAHPSTSPLTFSLKFDVWFQFTRELRIILIQINKLFSLFKPLKWFSKLDMDQQSLSSRSFRLLTSSNKRVDFAICLYMFSITIS